MKGGGKSALKQRYKMAFCRAWFLQAGNIAAISPCGATLRQLLPGIGSNRSSQRFSGNYVKAFLFKGCSAKAKKEAAWKAAPASDRGVTPQQAIGPAPGLPQQRLWRPLPSRAPVE
jgi:hypothetical protein